MTHTYSTYTSVLYMDDCFLDCYNPEQLNYVKQIIVINLLRNIAGARASMEMYCHKLGCYLTFTTRVVKVDMPNYVEVAILGLKSASPADMPAESAPLVI